LVVSLDSLDVQGDFAASEDMQAVQSVGDWLKGAGQPGVPWTPDPAWLELSLPVPAVSASAIATISAIASLRAQLTAQLGIDLLVPGQATAFVRLAATLAARLEAVASANAAMNLSHGVAAWAKLASVATAAADVGEAISQGVFEPGEPNPDSAEWQKLGSQLKPLLPLLSLSAQLGLNLSASFTSELSAMVGAIVKIQLPRLSAPAINLMATLSASFNAVAQLKLVLGVDPLEAGFAEVQAMAADRVNEVVQQAGGSAALLALVTDPQPDLTFVTPANVSAAMAINAAALAALNWKVPAAAALPIVSVGLPIASLSAQLNAAFGLSASARPCGGTCDAAALLSATLKV
jgi:hypothetical protein